MSDPEVRLVWKLYGPRDSSAPGIPRNEDPEFWHRLSAFRGENLYDNGRRPKFKMPDGGFADPDERDFHSYHVIISHADTGEWVGCCRGVPLGNPVTSPTEELFGRKIFDELCATMGIERAACVEIGRWMLTPDFRGGRLQLGARIFASCVAVGRHLGFGVVVGNAGTRWGPDRLLARFGGRTALDLPLLHIPEYNDEIRAMYFRMEDMTPEFVETVDETAALLGLPTARGSGS